MSDCLLVKTWATMNARELSAFDSYTLLHGITEAADELDRLQTELNRANRIARAADRMFDAICDLRTASRTAARLLDAVINAADSYESAMSDTEAEKADRGEA